MEPYSYAPIQPKELLMCRFVTNGDQLSAESKTFPAELSPPYNALSYTWALTDEGPIMNWDIHTDGRRLPALASSYPFDEALRSNGSLLDGTWWWIDSIRIDQANREERGAHVRRMKHIYHDAHAVVVWLGERSDDSADAPAFVDFLVELDAHKPSNEDLRMTLHQRVYRDKWNALRHFFLRKWRTRVWTIQEFAIPEEVTFWYGTTIIRRDATFAALAMADRSNAPRFKDSIAFRHWFNRRRAWLLMTMRGSLTKTSISPSWL